MAGRVSFGQISESDFSSLLQALSVTTKGRSFLAEYSRRGRPRETVGLLDSLQRIEATIATVRDQLQPERIADELSRIAMTLEIATEGVEVDPEGSETARRFALIGRARLELASLARSLAGEVLPPPTAAKSKANGPIELIDDEDAFLHQLGLGVPDAPDER